MTLRDFIEQFSHNNEIYIENKENLNIGYRYLPEDDIKYQLMDWEMQYTNVRDCKVICIKNVIHQDEKGRMQTPAITIKIDTDKTEFAFVKEYVTMTNSPLWLYNEMHRTNIQGCDAC